MSFTGVLVSEEYVTTSVGSKASSDGFATFLTELLNVVSTKSHRVSNGNQSEVNSGLLCLDAELDNFHLPFVFETEKFDLAKL